MEKRRRYKPMLELKLIRIRRGMNQADLAAKIGVTQNSISMYETGLRFPNRFNLEKLAEALDCEVKDII